MTHSRFINTEVMGDKTARMFRKLIKTIAICCVLLSMVLSASAQQLSTYEKKRYDLAKETINQMADRFEDEREAFLLLFGLNMFIESGKSSDDSQSKLEDMYVMEELIESASTGSSSFWGDDFAKNYEYMRTLKDIYRSWKDKRKVLDQTRTKADIDREYKIRPTDGTIDKMISIVKIEFCRWATRGKYEKTVDYQNRLNTQGIAVFDSICFANISGKMCMSSPASKVVEEHYDPDKEQYIVTFAYGDESYKGRISSVCSVSPDEARAYKLGDITKMRIDGKWLVPAESEYDNIWLVENVGGYTKWERENRKTYYFKTVYTTTAKTEPLRICFKDIKFSYNEISDELKNHCFSNDEYNAKLREYYDTLYYYKEDFRKRLDKLKSDYSTLNLGWYADSFEEWFKSHSDHRVYGLNYSDYDDVYGILNKEYKKAICSYYALREYEGTLASIQAILGEVEGEIEESLSNAETTNNLDKLMNASDNSPVINKVIIDGKQITFVISKKEQVQGAFYNDKLKNTVGKPYKGKYDDSRCSNDDKLTLCERCGGFNGRDCQIFLIVNNKDAYKLSPKAAQQIYGQGLFR